MSYHYTPPEKQTFERLIISSIDEDEEQLKLLIYCFQGYNSTIAVGRSLAIYYNAKHIPNIGLHTLHIYPGGIKTYVHKKINVNNFHSSFIYNSPKVAHVSINRKMDKLGFSVRYYSAIKRYELFV